MTSFLEESELPGKLPSAKEMAAFDAATIASGVPSLELMDRAGSAAYDVINERILQKVRKFERVVVLCGPGNNGGDGFVVARGLFNHGYETSVILTACEKYSSDCHIQARKLNEKGHEFLLFGDAQGLTPGGLNARYISAQELLDLLQRADLVVDALLGTGQKSAPRGAIAEIIEALNCALRSPDARKVVVSIDMPTGIDTDNGQVYSPAIKADLTITIELIKRGMLQFPARALCGEIVVQPIGIMSEGITEFSVCQRSSIALPRRPADFHKGLAGHVLVIAGSSNMPGAAALCCSAALRAGAGLLTLGCLSAVKHYNLAPEVMLLPLSGSHYAPNALKIVKPWLSRVQVVLLGPGLGMAKDTQQFVAKMLNLLKTAKCPCVIDADALNHISALKKFPNLSNCVITPHPGEAARLLKSTTKQVQSDRYSAAKELHRLTGAVVVLKGASTVIYHGKSGSVCSAGNPYMATAGSGDVLAGIVAAFCAQGAQQATPLSECAKAAVFIHARAGDLALAKQRGPFIASDILRFIGKAHNVV